MINLSFLISARNNPFDMIFSMKFSREFTPYIHYLFAYASQCYERERLLLHSDKGTEIVL